MLTFGFRPAIREGFGLYLFLILTMIVMTSVVALAATERSGLPVDMSPIADGYIQPGVRSEDLTLQRGEDHFSRGNYDRAITEYKRFLFFHPDDHRTAAAYLKIGLAFGRLSDWQQSIEALRTAIRQTEDPRQKAEIRLQLATILIASNQTEIALTNCAKILSQIGDVNPSPPPTQSGANTVENSRLSSMRYLRSRTTFLQGVAYTHQYRWKEAQEAFLTSSLVKSETIQLLKSLAEEDGKSVRIAKWISTFLPGSGQVYAGEWQDGLNALVLNGTIVSAVVLLFRSERRSEAGLLASTILWRYYNGNRRNATEAVLRYNQKKNNRQVNNVLDTLNREITDQPPIEVEGQLKLTDREVR